jgi:hypothetical protein
MQIQKTLSVAEISISLLTGDDFAWGCPNSSFQVPDVKTDNGNESISIQAAEKGTIDFADYTEIYDNSLYYLWRMWKAKDGKSYIIALYKNMEEGSEKPYRILKLNNNLSDVRVFNANGNELIHPAEYLLTLIVSAYLNINRIGFLLHSSMVQYKGRGYLFPGNSGDGKTTLSRLWIHDNNSEVISDERVIVRRKNGILHAYGTPWFGTASIHKNRGIPVDKMFVIKHGERNTIRRLSPVEAVNMLLIRSFPSFWHKEGMKFLLEFVEGVVSELECYEYDFVPDRTAIDFIQEHIEDSNNLLS